MVRGNIHEFRYVNVPRASGAEFWTWGCTCTVHGAGPNECKDAYTALVCWARHRDRWDCT